MSNHAAGLSVDRLCEARTLYKAELDPELEKQVKEKCPHLLEEPEDYGEDTEEHVGEEF